MIVESTANFVIIRPEIKSVDQSSAETYLAETNAPVAERRTVILDLSSIQFLCSAALGAIVALVKQARNQGGRVVLAAPTPPVSALFTMVRLATIVTIAKDLDTARAAALKAT